MNRHIINALSLSRILFGLLFLYFVVFDFNIINLMVIFSLTIVSDVLDGYWARKYNLVMDEGSKVDVICDFLFIIFSTLALVLIDLAPSWFLIVIVLKLIEFFMTAGIGTMKYNKFGTYEA